MTDILIEKNIVYSTAEKDLLTADVYRPSKGEDLPAVLLIHGGAYQVGSKEMYSEWGPMLAEEGFVVMAINYRLATKNKPSWPGVVDDVYHALNWLVSKANEWNINPLRIGIIGDSAGAHLGSLLAFKAASHPSIRIGACVGVYGLYNLKEEGSERLNQIIKQLLGKAYGEDPNLYHDVSPIDYIDEMEFSPTFDTSFLVLWGGEDNIVPPSQSENFVKRLQENEINVQTVVFPDQGHFWLNLTPGLKGGSLSDYPNIEAVPKILKFLKETLCLPQVSNYSKKHIRRLVHLQ
ncbi:alpha/beta hydrolase [Bacillus sp. B15-48]|uniref:alpha/beta hydrolase n=1 Tax=Bacillus sp. B15-48 TaxID=1548601 RepID=UPI00193FAD75|nr:alpha/beta hydrolase [Bacillus sp. B15-48]MBM4764840.1 alpha/beta hydrolase fold domain-containing protein [Bacillus sp. B15-48]